MKLVACDNRFQHQGYSIIVHMVIGMDHSSKLCVAPAKKLNGVVALWKFNACGATSNTDLKLNCWTKCLSKGCNIDVCANTSNALHWRSRHPLPFATRQATPQAQIWHPCPPRVALQWCSWKHHMPVTSLCAGHICPSICIIFSAKWEPHMTSHQCILR